MKVKKKPEKVKHFQTEYGESISFPISVIKEYPKKLAFVHNNAVYYIFKLYDRLVIERSVIEDEQT